MKRRQCSQCREVGPCAQAGKQGAWVCQRCLWEESPKLVVKLEHGETKPRVVR